MANPSPPAIKGARRSARPVGELLQAALSDTLKKRGFAAADIISHWPDIVGSRLAGCSQPMQIVWPPRPKNPQGDAEPAPATLVLRVESAFALEVEMSAAQLVERVNAIFGWRCIGRIRIKQGPVQLRTRHIPAPLPPLPPDEARKLESELAGISEEGLRRALERLGNQVRTHKTVKAA